MHLFFHLTESKAGVEKVSNNTKYHFYTINLEICRTANTFKIRLKTLVTFFWDVYNIGLSEEMLVGWIVEGLVG